MTLLILGLVLWYVSHLEKRLAPGIRASLGEGTAKIVVAVLSLLSVVLMIVGYRAADFVPVYTPLPGMGHLNNTLMLIAVFLYGVGHSKGIVKSKIRHPMLTGTLIWAIAHLLVNGDMASIVLFGGIGIWSVLSMLLINAQGPWNRPATGTLRSDLIGAAIALVVYAVIAGIHIWLGHNPFLGTYG